MAKMNRKEMRVGIKAQAPQQAQIAVAALTGRKEDREIAAEPAWALLEKGLGHKSVSAAVVVATVRALLAAEGAAHDTPFALAQGQGLGLSGMAALRHAIDGVPGRVKSSGEATIEKKLEKMADAAERKAYSNKAGELLDKRVAQARQRVETVMARLGHYFEQAAAKAEAVAATKKAKAVPAPAQVVAVAPAEEALV